MEYMIGIAIPEDLTEKITEFCKLYGRDVTDPHIAIITPDMLIGVSGFGRKLQSFCLSQPTSKTIIGGPGSDESGKLFLTVLPGSLGAIRSRLVSVLKLKNDDGFFRPHVPLQVGKSGADSGFAEVVAQAKDVFKKPYPISVESLVLYSRADAESSFTVNKVYPLTGR